MATLARNWDISYSTVMYWRNLDKGTERDWDKLREKAHVANFDGSFDTAKAMQTMQMFLDQYHECLKQLQFDKNISALDQAKALSSLSDSFNKSVSSFRRVFPESDRLAIHLETLNLLAAYIHKNNPEQIKFFSSILENFGTHLRQKIS